LIWYRYGDTLSQGWISLSGAVNPSGLATALLVRHGTAEQRERWLHPLAAGELFAAFSITEP
jgi:alkylation response protein AidB-like acyl-CoA dehydrogenase